MLVAFAGLVLPVLAPLAAEDFGVSPIYVGVYVASTYGFAACAGLVCSGFIARFGPFRVSQTSLVLAALGLLFMSTGHIAALVLASPLLGLAYGPATPASSTMLVRGTPLKWMNLVFSIRQTGVPIGNMLAGGLLPALALAVGWQLAAAISALFCLALALAFQPLRARFDDDRDPTQHPFSVGMISAPLRLVFSVPALRRLALVSFIYAGMQVTFSAFLVTYLNHALGMPLVLAGALLSAGQAISVGGRIFWGLVADRLIKPNIVLGGLGFGMSLAAVLTGSFTAAWPFLAILVVVLSFGMTAVAWNGVHIAQLARLAPPGRATEVTAGSSFLTFSGVMSAPAAFSAILAASDSYALSFATLAALTFVGGASFFWPTAERSRA